MVITARLSNARFNLAPFNTTRPPRIIQLSCSAEGYGETSLLSIYAAGTFSVFETLQPGDALVIDTEKYTVTLNGQQVTNYAGNFFDIVPDALKLIYNDNSDERTVQTKVQYTEKYL